MHAHQRRPSRGNCAFTIMWRYVCCHRGGIVSSASSLTGWARDRSRRGTTHPVRGSPSLPTRDGLAIESGVAQTRARRLVAGTPPYGYRLAPHRVDDSAGHMVIRHRLVLDDERADTLGVIFSWFVRDGLGRAAIVTRLTADAERGDALRPIWCGCCVPAFAGATSTSAVGSWWSVVRSSTLALAG